MKNEVRNKYVKVVLAILHLVYFKLEAKHSSFETTNNEEKFHEVSC